MSESNDPVPVETRLPLVLGVLEHELTVAEPARRHGVSTESINRWRSRSVDAGTAAMEDGMPGERPAAGAAWSSGASAPRSRSSSPDRSYRRRLAKLGSGKSSKEIREAVSDWGGGVRSRGEAAHKGAAQGKGTAIMKLTTMTQVTIDGVMQGNGAASDEDRGNGFERGGWARGAGDDETRTFITQTYQRAEAFLFGRRTYELFAGSWGSIDQMRAHPIAVALNEAPTYVASTTLTAPRWEDTTVLRGDLAAAISELKAKPGGELQVHGSGALTRWLLENDLVDEMTLIVIPVILGQGARLFPETGPDLALDLVESRVDSKGVTIQVYRPAGRPRYATA